ncbi:efflux RND transporter periplasmic adaptor subunit [Ideonella sp. B7]|uniref:efflux RND transporter periplasmic adaptor subunit n=1 Tax=Ideonella benzenivorans TaxID=2831643 RepID=UPI001CEDE3BB|nr:efflux RND transporter periplasmic adaptor subunit [Ideonella benzenivorans]MCA6215857.1 efflux RND transporter periplasmic adaptor subunit [Ideonella benzenivorans]
MTQVLSEPPKRPLNADTVATQLGVEKSGTVLSLRRSTWVVIALLGLGALAALLLWKWQSHSTGAQYETEKVTAGNLVVRVTATGNLQPLTKVDVGSELSGTIDKVLVKDNDKVSQGQVLAILQTSNLQDQVQESESSLRKAKASLLQYKAATRDAQATMRRNEEAWKLSAGMVPSQSEVETSQIALEKARASEANAAAAVDEVQATLNTNRTNLHKASLRSPINGVVLKRSVEPGQTVAASYQVTTLFTLAQDLTQMKLEVNVDEADVGQVKEGQSAEFTVDAYPERTFPARIVRLRYGSDTTNNVVTYQAVLEVSNKDLSLRPGMTANARIVTLRHERVLQVPNAALRYAPPQTEAKSGSSVTSLLIAVPKQQKSAQSSTTIASGSEQTVWKLENDRAVAVRLQVGASDGRMTEVSKILSGTLKEGDRLIVDSRESSK